MSHYPVVKSMETLQKYLELSPNTCYLVFQYINHVVSIAETLGSAVAKSFLLQEAEFYEEDIDLEAKRFIAKRLYAFWRKKRLRCVHERLQCFPEVAFQPSSDIIIKLLSFDELSRNVFLLPTPMQTSTPKKALPDNSSSKVTVMPTQKKERSSEEGLATKRRSRRLKRTKEQQVDYLAVEENARSPIEEITKLKQQKIKDDWELLKKWKVTPISCKGFAKELRGQFPKKLFPHLPKSIEGFIRKLQDKDQKYRLMRVKHLLLSHQNILEKPQNILVMINYGNSGIDPLKVAANITTDKKINSCFYEYFSTIVEQKLHNHRQQFRRAIESCFDGYDLYEFMAQYPLKNDSYILQFDLQVIVNVKQICELVASSNKDFDSLSRKYLKSNEANMKKALYTAIFESPVQNKIWDAMRKAKSVYQFFQCLKQLREIPETNKTATTIFQLVVTFLRGGKKISFRDLEISLNFAPNHLRNHTVRILTRKLQNDIDYKMETFLQQNISVERKWKKLLRLLKSSQFEGAKVNVFGYSPEELLAILHKISSSEGEIIKVVEHEFRGEDVCEDLKNLIIAKHTQQNEKKQKNFQNFYEELLALTSEKILSLRRPLVDLLRTYGSVNLAVDGSTLTGYQLSNTIAMFYRDAARTKITLPNNLSYEISVLIEDSINEERARQLSKVFADS